MRNEQQSKSKKTHMLDPENIDKNMQKYFLKGILQSVLHLHHITILHL